MRDADDNPVDGIADDVPFLGERLAVRSMDDGTIATLSPRAGWGTRSTRRRGGPPFPAPTELLLRTPEGQWVGTTRRRTGGNAYTLAVDDVGVDHRLLLGPPVDPRGQRSCRAVPTLDYGR